MPWGKRAAQQHALAPGAPGAAAGAPAGAASTAVATAEVVETTPGAASFRDRGRLRRRLRFLRRARELAFRDVGGLIFDMRRFGRDRPDLVEAKLGALASVDRELRALERVLGDRRPIHELREPGLSSCPRCGALHASEDNFCPRCGLQFGGAQAMGEVGGAIAAPPQPPPAPLEQPPPAPLEQPTSATLVVPGSGLEQAAGQSSSGAAQTASATQAPPARAPAQAAAPAEAAPAPPPAPSNPPDDMPARPPDDMPARPPDDMPARPPDDMPARAPDDVSARPPDDVPARPPDAEQQTEIYRPRDAS